MADPDLQALFVDTAAAPDQGFSHAVTTAVSGRRRLRVVVGGAVAIAAILCFVLLVAGISGFASAWIQTVS